MLARSAFSQLRKRNLPEERDCWLGVRWRLLQLDGIEGDRPRECFGFRQEIPLRILWIYPLAIGLKGLYRMLVEPLIVVSELCATDRLHQANLPLHDVRTTLT